MLSQEPAAQGRGTVLVVDDDSDVRFVVASGLRQAGFSVEEAETGEVALQKLSQGRAEAVISDISMPGLSGVEMLRLIRARDLDIPVVLLTGRPSLETAIEAVEGGALRYLKKPAAVAEITVAMDEAVRLGRLARWRREALALTRPFSQFVGDRASMQLAFEEALEGLWLAAQPIVGAKNGVIFGMELLARSISTRFTSVNMLVEAAEKLDRVAEFGRRVRHLAANVDVAPDHTLFVNMHSLELDDEELYSEQNPLRNLGCKVILEVTERHSIDLVKNLKEKIALLRNMGFWIAVDDMGAGYAGLNSFAALRPDIVKLDMSIVRGIDQDPYRRTLVRSMAAMCRDFGIPLVAEGVETEAEKSVLVELGCDFLQGFLCGAPKAPRIRSPGSPLRRPVPTASA
ncbi:MAG: EAL domain-containing response regulator [Vicinamibacteria bacterium]|nr:EAL domain-containing response regulator [Vicinamibacteria bacterium]